MVRLCELSASLVSQKYANRNIRNSKHFVLLNISSISGVITESIKDFKFTSVWPAGRCFFTFLPETTQVDLQADVCLHSSQKLHSLTCRPVFVYISPINYTVWPAANVCLHSSHKLHSLTCRPMFFYIPPINYTVWPACWCLFTFLPKTTFWLYWRIFLAF